MMIFLRLFVSVACVEDRSYYDPDALGSLSYYQKVLSVFEKADTDGNQQMSLAEMEDRFRSKYDVNGDGEVSRYEYTENYCKNSPGLYKLSHYLFDGYDSNGDDKLDTGDFSAPFNKTDTTGDGAVGQREFINYWNEVLSRYEDNGPLEEMNMEKPSECL